MLETTRARLRLRRVLRDARREHVACDALAALLETFPAARSAYAREMQAARRPKMVRMRVGPRVWHVMQTEPVIIGVDERGNKWRLERLAE